MQEKNKGLVRHVDSLGRVVIPREVRGLLDINYGDRLEFFLSNRSVIMKKSYVLSELEVVYCVANLLESVSNVKIYIFDTDKLICCDGKKCSFEISPKTKSLVSSRKHTEALVDICGKMIDVDIFPVIVNGDSFGSILVSGENASVVGEKLQKLLVDYLG